MKWLAFTIVMTLGSFARAESAEPFEVAQADRLSLSVNHHFNHEEVIARLSYLLEYWKKKYNIVSEWRGDRVFLSGSIYGVKIEALFAVSESSVTGFAKDPGWPWRGKVVAYVDSKLKKYLNPNFEEPK